MPKNSIQGCASWMPGKAKWMSVCQIRCALSQRERGLFAIFIKPPFPHEHQFCQRVPIDTSFQSAMFQQYSDDCPARHSGEPFPSRYLYGYMSKRNVQYVSKTGHLCDSVSGSRVHERRTRAGRADTRCSRNTTNGRRRSTETSHTAAGRHV